MLMLTILKNINSRFKIKRRVIFTLKFFFIRIFWLQKANWFSALIAEHLAEIKYKISSKVPGPLYYTAANPILFWRAKTLLTKEPETIAWLDRMVANDVFFDIGANIGMYSIYAGKKKVKVYGFEPEASNYYFLNKNIQINDISTNTVAYNFALSDKESVDKLKIPYNTPGSAFTTFGNNKERYPTIFEQGCIGMTLDDIVSKHGLPVPDYLKIDVDGIEAKIIRGAQNLIRNSALRSILIELDDNLESDQQWIKSFLYENGFKIVKMGEKCNGMQNCIFERDLTIKNPASSGDAP